MKTYLLLLFFTLGFAFRINAGGATWNLNPTSGDWNTATNWTPHTVPNGPDDIATFDVSNTTDIAFTDPISTIIGGIVFTGNASSFTFTAPRPALLYVQGPITNQSAAPQNFIIGAFNTINFNAFSTAGKLTTYTALGGTAAGFYGATVSFSSSASAEEATIIADGGTVSGALITTILFHDSSTAAQSTLIGKGGVPGAPGASIRFFDSSKGDTARVEVLGNGNLDLSGHDLHPGVTVGSIEGDGTVFLGAVELTVGPNRLSTIFSGSIRDGGFGGGSGGSLTKVGPGTLILTHANTYTGWTTIRGGKLLVNNADGSGTGMGLVFVNRGKLGGRGIIAGPVSVGTGSGSGAFLSPGRNAASPQTLTLQSTLTMHSDATYYCGLNSNRAAADQVVANGVTIDDGALFSLADAGTVTLPIGTVFTAINNTAATPIAGRFSNLADGATITVGSNIFQANYEGGDGNDLTLTVVP